MSKIQETFQLDLVSEKPDDIILEDPILLKQVAEFYNTHKETILLIANCLNTSDAKYLIQHALDEEVPIYRAKMIARESFYTELVRYSAEQARRDEKAKQEANEEEKPTVDVTLESPPNTDVEGSV